MLELLIAVKSCFADRRVGCHQIIRETWGRNIPKNTNLIFFLGGIGNSPSCSFGRDDELILEVEDDYDHLPDKTRKILWWSVEAGFDYTFLCDVDTFLVVSKLLETGFEAFDYSGRFGSSPAIGTTFSFRDGRGRRHEKCHPWASGGFGYFLSEKAAKIVSSTEPKVWAEDMFVGQTLGPFIQDGSIKAADLQNFECEVSWHYPARFLGWNRQNMQSWMREKDAQVR